MKLLYCGHCGDIVRLLPDRRSCKCGRSWGHYLDDNSTTVQSDCSLSIGFANQDFDRAVGIFLGDRDRFSPSLTVRAWINPDSEPDVKYVEEEPQAD